MDYSYDRSRLKEAAIITEKQHQKDLAKIRSVKWEQVPPETLQKILAILKKDLVGF